MKCTYFKIETDKLNLFVETTEINIMRFERRHYI